MIMKNGMTAGIEPGPPVYGCNFATELVKILSIICIGNVLPLWAHIPGTLGNVRNAPPTNAKKVTVSVPCWYRGFLDLKVQIFFC
jgi:hypothetical protein